ncbi:cyclic nucleotide-binding domain-containing protein [Aestuariibacter salexigens]|uniref:cyclic nucleotide-binding domain-containing protein n=1 Tax=Aestuariibacter salexigens TaxID=226010 RepID=UPI00040F2783|nr:cyclic nucleotide-binding domain-containing protein [Aestuariibacter salexigens]
MDGQQIILGAKSDKVSIDQNQHLFTAGEVNTSFYRVVQGQLSVSMRYRDGSIALLTVSEGQWLGELPHNQMSSHLLDAKSMTPCLAEKYDWKDVKHKERANILLLDLFAPVLQKFHFCQAMLNALNHLSVEVTARFVQKLMRYCDEVELDAGQTLFKQGENANAAYLLLSGRLEVTIGSSATEVGQITRGELFGEMGLLTGEPRSATLTAARHCHLARLPAASFQRLFKAFPELGQFMINTLIRRLQAQNERLSRNSAARNRLILSCNGVTEDGLDPVLTLCEKANTGFFNHQLAQLALRTDSGMVTDNDVLAEWLEEQELNHDLNLYHCRLTDKDWLQACLQRADELWIFADSSQSPAALKQQLANIMATPSWQHTDKTLVLCHQHDLPSKTRTWLDTLGIDTHLHLFNDDGKSTRRMSRYLTDTTVGLVLGGGGAKGFAHVGVMQALEEAQIEIDAIGGTSIGAVMGGWLARGWNSEQARKAINHYFVQANPLGDYTLPLISLSRSERLDTLLQHSFKALCIEDLPIPFYCMSSDLSVAREVCHQQGLVWRAIRASLSIPGVIKPQIEDGHFLVDGGLLNNLPVDVMRQQINGTVIAIDVSDKNSFLTELNALPSPWALAWRKWVGREQLKVPSILETLLRSTMLASDSRRNRVSQQADCYIKPDVEEFGMLAFTRADEVIEKGYTEGQKVVEQIKQHLNNR